MTLMITLSSVEEARLQAAARQAGSTPGMLAKKLVTEYLPPSIEVSDSQEAARIIAIKNACGSMAHFRVGAEDLNRERRADKRSEEAHVSEPAL